jgi:putative ABC transport system permease protein
VGELWRRIEAWLRRRSLDRDLEEELRFHLDMKAREVGDRAAARRALGSSLLLRERAREAWGWRWLDDMLWDIRYALRQFRRHPGFTAVAVLTLAIGIGVNATVFTVTNAMFFNGFPHVDLDNRIRYIGTRSDTGMQSGGVSYPDFEDWGTQTKSFDGLAVVGNGGLRLPIADQDDSPEIYDGTQVSVTAFQVLRQTPVLGRDFAPTDGRSGAAPVAILSYGLWERRYAKNPDIVGHVVRIAGTPTRVIGVMGRSISFPHRVDLWVPLVPTADLEQRQSRRLWFAFGRLADGVTTANARAEMETIGRRLERSYPSTNHGFRPVVMTFDRFFLGPDAATLYGSMSVAVACVLLIACASLANLLLARATGRSREISVRISLGAGRGRIIRQLLIKSVMLSGVGGLLGWWMTTWSVRSYERFAAPPSTFDHWVYAIDHRVLIYLAAISIGAGLLFGLAPASRLSRLDVNNTLKDGGPGTAGPRGRRLSMLLVIAETALAIVLLAGAGVMIRSFLRVYTADLGVRPSHVLTASVRLPSTRYPDHTRQVAFFEQLTTRLEALPGVESVAIGSSLPMFPTARVPFELEGTSPLDDPHRPVVSSVVISESYFQTLGATVLIGRAFSASDAGGANPVVIVNHRFANTVWPGEHALGKRLRLLMGATPDAWRTVVGIASNIVQNDRTGQTVDAVVYIPFRQTPGERRSAGGLGFGRETSSPLVEMTMFARTLVPPESLAISFRRQIQAIDSNLVIGSGVGSIGGPKTLAESLALNYWANGLNGGLFLIFALIALVLASIGLYAVVAFDVSQRTQEIGIRTAMGATASDIRGLVFRQGMLPVGIGLTIGLPAALAVTRILKSQLVNVSPTDPITLFVASGFLVLAATLGCWIPARRAIRVDPVVALRHE